jgi:hypothetical protein
MTLSVRLTEKPPKIFDEMISIYRYINYLINENIIVAMLKYIQVYFLS